MRRDIQKKMGRSTPDKRPNFEETRRGENRSARQWDFTVRICLKRNMLGGGLMILVLLR